MNNGFVIGVDAGATTTRAAAVDLDGVLLGRGTAAGANPNSHPPAVAAGRIAEAIGQALHGLDPAGARGCVVGMAGASKLADPVIAAEFDRTWQSIGLGCEVVVRTDAEVAYASATGEPDGTIVIAGTGSITARIAGHRMSGTVGGYGWLLGDEGSAFWLGREAVRATLAQLQGDEPLSPLAQAVLAGDDAVDGRRAAFSRLVASVNARPPIDLATYAPLVSAHADDDPVATEIVVHAVKSLAATVGEPDGSPVVLMGSVAGAGSPVGAALTAVLTERGHRVASAADGAAGAAWLAAVSVVGEDAPRLTDGDGADRGGRVAGSAAAPRR